MKHAWGGRGGDGAARCCGRSRFYFESFRNCCDKQTQPDDGPPSQIAVGSMLLGTPILGPKEFNCLLSRCGSPATTWEE